MNYKQPKKVIFPIVCASLFWFGGTHAISPSACCGENIRGVSPVEISDNIQQGQSFDPCMFYLVDQIEGNFLFRGNMPQMNGNFDDADLTNSIIDTLSKLGIPFSSPYQLLDLSFLNAETEAEEIAVELNWFKQNPDAGCFWLNSLYGTFFNPVDFPSFMRNFILEHHDVDGLQSLVPEIRNLLEQQCTTHFVIYMHCNAGRDRTGEASACYLMQYKDYSYEEAVALNCKIAGRAVRDREQNAIRWYAFYLRDIVGITTIGTIEGV